MPTQYIMPMARNVNTGQTQKIQDLAGGRFTQTQHRLAQQVAEQYAHKLSQSTGDVWEGFIKDYSPTS